MDWATIGVLGGFIAIWSGVILFAVKWILDQTNTHIKSLVETQTKRTELLERSMVAFREELPRDYVRREDWIRLAGTIDAKLDSLWRALQQRGSGNAR